MKIKKGDTIKVMVGKDKGKTGKIVQAFPGLGRVSAAGVNISYKHLRSGKKGQSGQKIEFPSPIRLANVALVCPHCGAAGRVGFSQSQDGQAKQRLCKKCKGAF